MSDPRDLIDAFYRAFASKDGEAMAACYHPEARFSDPVFVDLDATEAGGMWRMFCERGGDLRVEHDGVWTDGDRGGARWQAWYTFSATGRPVHNEIDATFRFADGKFIAHHDEFSFWRWSKQALGAPGLLLGWTPFVRSKVQKLARRGLNAFLAERPPPHGT